jgi:hypothetical protein
MNGKSCILSLITLVLVPSCTDKILKPLQRGELDRARSTSREYNPENRPMGNSSVLYLVPRGNLSVRAIEDCRILTVVTSEDSDQVILATGRFDVGYGNIRKSFVSKGDTVLKG